MTFEDWMRYRGLSKSSITKYAGAIQGPISEWAMENSLTSGPLNAFTSASAFNAIAPKIQLLAIFQERNRRGHNMYSSALSKFSEYLGEGYENDVEEDIDDILSTPGLSATERTDMVKTRIGQGVFRQKLLLHWKACAVTGFKDINLLVASHIKPWRVCNSTERLNPFNGLLLTPNLDKAFDAGLITFAQKGPIAVSPQLTEPSKLGIHTDMRVNLEEEHQPFMNFHREQVFRSA